eukprot:Nk52_evm4s274 gene=Nk52_evmTU4s274
MKLLVALVLAALATCNAQIPSGTYNMASGNCETFNGIRCTLCAPGYFLGKYDNVCYAKCPDGQLEVAATRTCDACQGTTSNSVFVCKECSGTNTGATANLCTIAADGYSLISTCAGTIANGLCPVEDTTSGLSQQMASPGGTPIKCQGTTSNTIHPCAQCKGTHTGGATAGLCQKAGPGYGLKDGGACAGTIANGICPTEDLGAGSLVVSKYAGADTMICQGTTTATQRRVCEVCTGTHTGGATKAMCLTAAAGYAIVTCTGTVANGLCPTAGLAALSANNAGDPAICLSTTTDIAYTCKTCSTGATLGKCTTAADGYFLQDGIVQPLSKYNCKAGTGGPTQSCTSCVNGALISAGTGSFCNCAGAVTANTGQFYSSGSCTDCASGCATCSAADNGQAVFSSFYLLAANSKNTCPACTGNCVKCSDGNANGCTEAAAGFFLSSGTPTACASTTLCKTCSSNTVCTAAADGAYLVSGTATSCGQTGCKTCTSTTVCTSVLEGYFLLGNAPVACAKNCKTCSWSDSTKTSTCSACKTGYALQSGSCQSTCSAGYFNSNGVCTACAGTTSKTVRVCDKCTSAATNACTLAAPGHGLITNCATTTSNLCADATGVVDPTVAGTPAKCQGTTSNTVYICKECLQIATAGNVKGICRSAADGYTLKVTACAANVANGLCPVEDVTSALVPYSAAGGDVMKCQGTTSNSIHPCAQCKGTHTGGATAGLCQKAGPGYGLKDGGACAGTIANGICPTEDLGAGSLVVSKYAGADTMICQGTTTATQRRVCEVCTGTHTGGATKAMCLTAAAGYAIVTCTGTVANGLCPTAGLAALSANNAGDPAICSGTTTDIAYKCKSCSTSDTAGKCTGVEGCDTASGTDVCSECKGDLVLVGSTNGVCGAKAGYLADVTAGTVSACSLTTSSVQPCAVCSTTAAAKCLTANNGYFVAKSDGSVQTANTDGTATACIEGCSVCTGTTAALCTVWKQNYYNSSGTMAVGPVNCAVATGQYVCSQCDVGYNLYLGGCVAKCPFGFFASGGMCMALGSNCDAGVDATSCTVCKQGYYPWGGACVACETGCARCEGTAATATAGTCLEPMPGYYLAVSGGKLGVTISIPATKGVPTLCAGSNCQFCQKAGSDTNTAVTAGTCIVPNAGYFLSATTSGTAAVSAGTAGNPVACATGCSKCSGSAANACTAAMKGYYLNSATATACASNTNAGDASTQTTAGSCTTANNGYYISSGTTAVACSANCEACTSSACTTCRPTYVMSGVTARTCGCTTGYFSGVVGNATYATCNACSANCNACSSATVCTTCDAASKKVTNGTVVSCESTCPTGQLDVSGVCTACTSPCATCSGTVTTCASCIAGYTLSGTTCSQNSTSNGTTPNNPTSSCDKTAGTGCTSPQVCLLSGGVFNCVSPIALGADCSTSGSATSDPVPCVSGAICFASSASSSKCVNASVGSTGTGTTRPTDANSNIDSTVNLGDNVSFGTAVKIGAGSAISYNVTIGSSVTMGTGVQVATGVQVKDSVTLKDNVVVAQGVILNSGAQVGSGVNIGKDTNVGANVVLGKGTSVAPSCTLTAGCALGEGVVLNTGSSVGADSVLGATAKPTTVTKATVTGKISGATLTLGTGNIFQGTYSIGATNTFGNSNTAEPNFTTGDSLTVGNSNIFKNGVEVNGGITLTSGKTFSGTVTSDANGVPNTAAALFTSPYMVSAAIATALYMML